MTQGDIISIWNPWIIGESPMKPLFIIEKKVTCMQLDPNKGLLFLALEDGHTMVRHLRASLRFRATRASR